jgi:two-component system phosphate regulon response regulator PhoB
MPKSKILVIEDEEDILALIRYNLSREGFEVREALAGEEALKMIFLDQPDLILLDLMLPGMDGIELCRTLKHDAKIKHIPVIMVTAKGEEQDIVKGLGIGADDYITKPFSPKVLVARIRAALRRKDFRVPGEQDVIKIHDMVIHPGRFEVLIDGKPVQLTRTEFQVLHFLARRPGWVYTRYQIVDGVKGEDYPVTDRAVDVTIVGLRKKLGDRAEYIETVRGIGYRFRE